MSQTAELVRHYREVRNRLRCPPNAVPDMGIDLKRKTVAEAPPPPEPPAHPLIQLVPPKPPSHPETTPPPPLLNTGFAAIVGFVAFKLDITPAAIRRRNRSARLSFARYIAVHLACELTDRSMSSMAKYLGLDHSTVMHGRKKVIRKMAEDVVIRKQVKDIEAALLVYFAGLAIPAERKQALALKPGTCTQVSELSSVDS